MDIGSGNQGGCDGCSVMAVTDSNWHVPRGCMLSSRLGRPNTIERGTSLRSNRKRYTGTEGGESL